MPVQLGFSLCADGCADGFCATKFWRRFEVGFEVKDCLEQSPKHGIRMRGGLGAGCALALMCVLLVSHAPARDSAAGASKPSKSAAQTSSARAKSTTQSTHSKSSRRPGASKAATSSKTHASSHSSSSTHSASTHSAHSSMGAHAKSTASAHGGKSKYAKSRKGGKTKTVARGQQKIAPERAQEIQEALVREHYLTEAAGTWDAATEDAMRRYQADHGWQSKTVPDARALIALGLGPSHEHLLNPESAMTTEPESPRATALAPSSQRVDPGAPMNPNPPAPGSSVEHDSGSPQ